MIVCLQLPENLDMAWDDGTRNVEPVMDIYAAEHISLVRLPSRPSGTILSCTVATCAMGQRAASHMNTS